MLAFGATGAAAQDAAPPPPSSQAEVSVTTPLGINVNRVMNDAFDGARWDRHLAAARQDGIRMVRSDAFWHLVQSRPPVDGVHSYNWLIMDFYAVTFARHGLLWSPVLGYSAQWATADPGGDMHAPPRNADDYAAFVGAFAARYGRGGSFWSEYPDLPRVPVSTYEIWNEPNFNIFWKTGPDPARYADLYLRARAAIKAVDPQATVVTGGLMPWRADQFVRSMYAARPDLRGQVDGVGLHPYAQTPLGVFNQVRAMRETLQSLGDGAVPLHLTELGWVTSGGGVPRLDEPARAAALETTTDTLARSDCGVASVIPYTWMTPERNPADAEDWYGIVRPDTTRTPSSRAYSRVVERYGTNPPNPSRRIALCQGSPPAAGDGYVPLGPGAPPTVDRRAWTDSDRDGIADTDDPDDDNDRRGDHRDAFPLDPSEKDDVDGDRVGDNADTDDDGDGLLDTAEQALGTVRIDMDSDDDGLSDREERRTDPTRRDTDGDRLGDGLELGRASGILDPPTLVRATHPERFTPDSAPRTRTRATRKDTDRDGLKDGREDKNRNGRRDRRETDPNKRDTDLDGVRDGRDRHPLDRRRR